MIHLSYDQEITLIKRLLAPLNVVELDADYLAKVVTHSDFTGTYSHGLSRLCIYLRQYMAGALQAQPDFRCVIEFFFVSALFCHIIRPSEIRYLIRCLSCRYYIRISPGVQVFPLRDARSCYSRC